MQLAKFYLSALLERVVCVVHSIQFGWLHPSAAHLRLSCTWTSCAVALKVIFARRPRIYIPLLLLLEESLSCLRNIDCLWICIVPMKVWNCFCYIAIRRGLTLIRYFFFNNLTASGDSDGTQETPLQDREWLLRKGFHVIRINSAFHTVCICKSAEINIFH